MSLSGRAQLLWAMVAVHTVLYELYAWFVCPARALLLQEEHKFWFLLLVVLTLTCLAPEPRHSIMITTVYGVSKAMLHWCTMTNEALLQWFFDMSRAVLDWCCFFTTAVLDVCDIIATSVLIGCLWAIRLVLMCCVMCIRAKQHLYSAVSSVQRQYRHRTAVAPPVVPLPHSASHQLPLPSFGTGTQPHTTNLAAAAAPLEQLSPPDTVLSSHPGSALPSSVAITADASTSVQQAVEGAAVLPADYSAEAVETEVLESVFYTPGKFSIGNDL